MENINTGVKPESNNLALEKEGARSQTLALCHDESMNQLFENVFLPQSENSARWLIPDAVMVPVVTNSDPTFVPPRHSQYCFRKDILRTILAFLVNPHGSALYITGPTGSGKTSIVTEVCARLNWGVSQITMNERFEFATLRGTWSYKRVEGSNTPEMVFQDGPLATAMRLGHVLLLNEVDIAPAGEMSGMNDIIEGRPLTIPETGEVIKPHPLFRVIVTANSKGQGDEMGCYAGVQQQNIAAMDRYRFLEVGYPAEMVEKSLLTSILNTSLGKKESAEMAKRMVRLANRVRNEFVGLKGIEGTLHVPVSTRCLTTWAFLAQDYLGSKNAMKAAFEECYLRRCSQSEAQAVNDMAFAIFGDGWNLPAE